MASLRTLLARAKRNAQRAAYGLADAVMDTDHKVRFVYRSNGYHTPNYRFAADEIMFVHLAKTAGTSLAKILQGDPQQRFPNLNIHRPISGHCAPADFKYITVLREPVSRVWSYYHMVLRNPAGYPYRNYAAKGLETFLKKAWPARNMAVRYVAGRVEQEPTQQTLALAQKNLAQFYAVLLFEDFGAEATAFCKQHGIPVGDIPTERKASYAAPTEAEAALIASYNKLDIALYEDWLASRG